MSPEYLTPSPVGGPVLAASIPAKACIDVVYLRQDIFVLTFATIPRVSSAVRLTKQKLLRQLQVTIHTADTGVLPQTHDESLWQIYVQALVMQKSGNLLYNT